MKGSFRIILMFVFDLMHALVHAFSELKLSESFYFNSSKRFRGLNKIHFLLITFLLVSDISFAQGQTFTWMNGSDTANKSGSYGVKGISNLANHPGGRSSSASWVDANNNLWLFGGVGYDKNGNYGYLKDLWKYDISAAQWTWMGGSRLSGWNGSNIDSIKGNYGVKGESTSSNYPGARIGSNSWTDKSGNLWLFGGEGYDKNNLSRILNDLWKYNIASGQWTWMGGRDLTVSILSGVTFNAVVGVYGTKGVMDPSNVPGPRNGAVSWQDLNGDLWLFGGHGVGRIISSTFLTGALNDLWKFENSSNQWTWMGGSDTIYSSGVFGVKGIADGLNIPGGRDRPVSWLDSVGNFWLYGGISKSDLWKYETKMGVWTWIAGQNFYEQSSIYGTLNVV